MDKIVLVRTWEMLKAYIPKKELPLAAEQLVNYLTDEDMTNVIDELADNCPVIAQVLHDLDEEEDYEDDDYDEEEEW